MISGDMSTHLEIDNNTLFENATLCELLSIRRITRFCSLQVEVDHPNSRCAYVKIKIPVETANLVFIVILASCSECMFNDTGANIYWQICGIIHLIPTI